MTFYQIAVRILQFVFKLFNGPAIIKGLDNLPDPEDGSYIYAITHRSLFDPFYIACYLYPRKISFMAKESLFKNSLLGNLLKKAHVFPVNREKPSPKTIKFAVKQMTEQDLNLGIFPSGSRYSTEIKGGTGFIQRLSKKDIIPISIQPPLSAGQFFSRKKAKINIGSPIKYKPELAYDKEDLAQIDQTLAQAFDQLDKELDPNYIYTPPKKKN